MLTLGLLINPFAGIGGAVGLKGSDGQSIVEEAFRRGATRRAAERAKVALEILLPVSQQLRFLSCSGDMGQEVLDELETRGINFCIASNAPKAKTLRNATSCGIVDYFANRAIYSAHDLKAWKPDPGMFLHAANTEGVTPDQCLIIEDSEAGIEAGLAAGIKVVFYDAHQSGTKQSPTETVTRFSDVLAVI